MRGKRRRDKIFEKASDGIWFLLKPLIIIAGLMCLVSLPLGPSRLGVALAATTVLIIIPTCIVLLGLAIAGLFLGEAVKPRK